METKENIFYIPWKDWIIFQEKLSNFLSKEDKKPYTVFGVYYKVKGSLLKGYKIKFYVSSYSKEYNKEWGISKRPWEYLNKGINQLLAEYIPEAKYEFTPFEGSEILHSEIVYCPLIKLKNK